MSTKPLLLVASIVAAGALGFWLGRQSPPSQSTGRAPAEGLITVGEVEPLPPSALPGKARTLPPAPETADPVAALADPTVEHPFETLNERISRMGPLEMTALFHELRKRSDHPQQGLLEGILTMHLIGRAPGSMIDIKLAYPDLPVLGRTYHLWGQSDPEAALAHIEGMKNETWYQQGMSAIFAGMGKADPERALWALNGISDIESRHYGSLFAAWLTRSADSATAAVDRVPPPHRPVVLRSIADNFPEVDAEAARAWFAELPEADARIARPYYERRMRQLEIPLSPQP